MLCKIHSCCLIFTFSACGSDQSKRNLKKKKQNITLEARSSSLRPALATAWHLADGLQSVLTCKMECKHKVNRMDHYTSVWNPSPHRSVLPGLLWCWVSGRLHTNDTRTLFIRSFIPPTTMDYASMICCAEFRCQVTAVNEEPHLNKMPDVSALKEIKLRDLVVTGARELLLIVCSGKSSLRCRLLSKISGIRQSQR